MRTYVQKNRKIDYSDHYSTPEEIYKEYVLDGGYFDPCPLGADNFNFRKIDEPLFINPPYSDISTWVDYAIENHKEYGLPVVLLIPSRTDTKYFHRLLEYGVFLEFIKGRLKFGGLKGSAPFPSVLVHII